MLNNLFAPLAMKVAGGIALALALLAGVQTLRLSWAQRELAEVRADHARAAAQAVAQARKADAVAVDTAQAGKASVEEGNERAQEAARTSDDPLRAGLDSLSNR